MRFFARSAGLSRRESEESGTCAAVFEFRNQQQRPGMIRKLKSGGYRLYTRKLDPRTGKRRNLGTFKSRSAAEKHEREVQYFKRH
jgi:hypothetical protein